MPDTPEGEPAGRPAPDPPRTEPADRQPDPPRTEAAAEPPRPAASPAKQVTVKRSSGKGLAALMFFLGLLLGVLLGGIAGIYGPRTGVLQDLPGPVETTPAPAPSPTTITRTVEVEVLRTPQDCLDALDDLTGHIDRLTESREALMRADLARVSGDDEAAGTGFAEVDRQLRALIIAGNTRSLRSSIDNCRDAGDGAASTPSPEPSPTAEPSPEPTGTPGAPESPDLTTGPVPTPPAGEPAP